MKTHLKSLLFRREKCLKLNEILIDNIISVVNYIHKQNAGFKTELYEIFNIPEDLYTL